MSEVFKGMSVTVLMGGNSAERTISLKSGTAVANALTEAGAIVTRLDTCLLYTSPSPRDRQKSRMPSSA